MHGAALLYNYMLAEKKNDEETLEKFRGRITGGYKNITDNRKARDLLEKRELMLKKKRARLRYPRALELWSGDSGSGMLLEALRENAGRLAVFCHDGYISVPAQSTLLYSYLEQMVVPVLPEKGNGLFHPKIWVMRFTAGDEPVFYRFLCLSRNLTFDRSWDTSLKLEGFLTDRKKGYGRNRPLADLISMLKTIPVHGIGSAAAI